MNWYIKALKQYADFSGRARRKEYWMFVLFNIIFAFVLGFIDGLTGVYDAQTGYGVLGGLYILAVLIPSLAVTVRRLHDVGKSGWMYFIILIPFIGAIWLLVLMLTDGNSGVNEYGPNPKGVIA